MRELRFLLALTGMLTGAAAVIVAFCYRFHNPELTETQLLFATWHYYLLAVFGWAVGCFCLTRRDA